MVLRPVCKWIGAHPAAAEAAPAAASVVPTMNTEPAAVPVLVLLAMDKGAGGLCARGVAADGPKKSLRRLEELRVMSWLKYEAHEGRD